MNTYEEWLKRHLLRWKNDAALIISKLEEQIQELQECPDFGENESWVKKEIESVQHYIEDMNKKTRGHEKRLEGLHRSVQIRKMMEVSHRNSTIKE